MKNDKRGFFTLAGLILALLILLMLYYIATRFYFGRAASGEKIEYKGAWESSKSKIEDINKNRSNQIEGLNIK